MFTLIKRSIIWITLIALITILTGCLNSNYEEFRTEFIKSYIIVADLIDQKDIPSALKKLDSVEAQKEINKLNMLLEKMMGKVPSAKEKEYEQLSEWYNELVSLRGIGEKYNDLSSDEKMIIYGKVIDIYVRRDWYKKHN